MRRLTLLFSVFFCFGCQALQATVIKPTTFDNPEHRFDQARSTVALTPTWCNRASSGEAQSARHVYQLVQDGVSQAASQQVHQDQLPCDAFAQDMFVNYDSKIYLFGLVPLPEGQEPWTMKLAYRQALEKAMTPSHADDYLLATYVSPLSDCFERRNSLRDSSGRTVATVGTGQTVCNYTGSTKVTQLVVNAQGTVVWRSTKDIDTTTQSYDRDVSQLLTKLPVKQFAQAR